MEIIIVKKIMLKMDLNKGFMKNINVKIRE